MVSPPRQTAVRGQAPIFPSPERKRRVVPGTSRENQELAVRGCNSVNPALALGARGSDQLYFVGGRWRTLRLFPPLFKGEFKGGFAVLGRSDLAAALEEPGHSAEDRALPFASPAYVGQHSAGEARERKRLDPYGARAL